MNVPEILVNNRDFCIVDTEQLYVVFRQRSGIIDIGCRIHILLNFLHRMFGGSAIFTESCVAVI